MCLSCAGSGTRKPHNTPNTTFPAQLSLSQCLFQFQLHTCGRPVSLQDAWLQRQKTPCRWRPSHCRPPPNTKHLAAPLTTSKPLSLTSDLRVGCRLTTGQPALRVPPPPPPPPMNATPVTVFVCRRVQQKRGFVWWPGGAASHAIETCHNVTSCRSQSHT